MKNQVWEAVLVREKSGFRETRHRAESGTAASASYGAETGCASQVHDRSPRVEPVTSEVRGTRSDLCEVGRLNLASMDARPAELFEGRWWLVHTKPRNEKALATDLDRQGISYFLALARVKRRYNGHTTYVRLPLFPSYVFLRGGESERYATLTTHRVVSVIRVVDQERLRADLRQIYIATTSNKPVNLYPGIRRGRRCRVARGSLKGLEGIVLRRRDVCRVYVAVETLGQSAELEIDASVLEVIE